MCVFPELLTVQFSREKGARFFSFCSVPAPSTQPNLHSTFINVACHRGSGFVNFLHSVYLYLLDIWAELVMGQNVARSATHDVVIVGLANVISKGFDVWQEGVWRRHAIIFVQFCDVFQVGCKKVLSFWDLNYKFGLGTKLWDSDGENMWAVWIPFFFYSKTRWD